VMDGRTWAVVIVYGLVVGYLLARLRQEQRTLLTASAVMAVIGVVTWVVAPSSIAGPSMAVGGAAVAAAMSLVGLRSNRER